MNGRSKERLSNSFFVLFLSLFLSCLSLSHSAVVSRVVAEVNGEIITSQELDQVLRPLYAKYKRAYSGEELNKHMEEARRDALSQLIERKLVLQEAKKQNIQIEDKKVEERFQAVKSKFDSDDEFYYALEKEGMTTDQLRENIREQLLVKTLSRQEILRSIHVRPKEVSDYYSQNTQRFSEPEMVQMGQILVKKGDHAEAAKQKIEEAQKKLKGGTSFEAVAKEYSEDPYAKEGGDMPFFAKGNLMKEIEDEAFSMEVGQTSETIESDLGYHILTLKARKQDRVKPLSEVYSEIEEELYQQKVEAFHEKWVEKLKKKAHVVVY
ncbi:MAG: SurA N-terminal domain-containing protein [Chlamydiae bacterium]|nr:SurA N-terminal domain-containing protein [Chlamydiota bacterium]MBI3265711.1 SurA N-terminal domain-containing protein [Chlamydiota bacterium]